MLILPPRKSKKKALKNQEQEIVQLQLQATFNLPIINSTSTLYIIFDINPKKAQ
jgi:hypothetical protein